MNDNQLGTRIKKLRNNKGLSQDSLSIESGLSLRTIQRIENGESNPTGDSLKRLANALDVSPDELIDWGIKEDSKYLTYMNLSATTFLFFPILGVIVPFIMWTSKKDKIKNINELGKSLINFEITWSILLFFTPLLIFLFANFGIIENTSIRTLLTVTGTIVGVMYLFNLIFIAINTLRVSNGQSAFYFPQIKFLR